MHAYRQSPARNVMGQNEAMGGNHFNCKIGPSGRSGNCLQGMKWAQARLWAATVTILKRAHPSASAATCCGHNWPKQDHRQRLISYNRGPTRTIRMLSLNGPHGLFRAHRQLCTWVLRTTTTRVCVMGSVKTVSVKCKKRYYVVYVLVLRKREKERDSLPFVLCQI